MVKIENVSKKYVNFEALKACNLEFPEGKVIGILGPNGSGKTTLLRILASELKPTTGDFSINGVKRGVKVKRYISSLTSPDFIPNWMSIKGAKNHYISMYGDFDRDKFERLLEFLNLTENLKVGSLSKGMRSKLNLALTISRNAPLVILDEPLDGVDPVAREEILNMIDQTFDGKSTLLITSHLINELENLLDEVYFIRDGHIKYIGDAKEVKAKEDKTLDEIYRQTYKNIRSIHE